MDTAKSKYNSYSMNDIIEEMNELTWANLTNFT